MADNADDRARLLRIKCKTQGHTFAVLTHAGGEPSGVVCRGCGRTWPLRDNDDPTEGTR